MKNIGKLVVTIAALFFMSKVHTTTWHVHPGSTLNSIQADVVLLISGEVPTSAWNGIDTFNRQLGSDVYFVQPEIKGNQQDRNLRRVR